MTPVPQTPDLLTLARANDPVALETMFRQFIGENEELIYARFFGRRGVFGLGPQCFAAVTNRRVASIQYSKFGEVVYQDGFLNKITSSVVYQPSLLWLVCMRIMVVILAIPTVGLALLLGPGIATLFYAVNKSGVSFIIGDGVDVFLFCDRRLIRYANELQRCAMDLAGHSETKARGNELRGTGTAASAFAGSQVSPAVGSRTIESIRPKGSNRVRVTDEGLTRWCIRYFMMAWLGAILGASGAFAFNLFEWQRYEHSRELGDRRDTERAANFELEAKTATQGTSTGSSNTDGITVDALEALVDYYRNLALIAAICGSVMGAFGGISLILGIVSFVWWVGRRCDQVPVALRRIDGGTARLLLAIPVVNLIATFFILPKLADSYDAAADEYVDGTPPKSAYGIGIAICVVTLLPFVNLAVNPFFIRTYLRRIDHIKSTACGTPAAST